MSIMCLYGRLWYVQDELIRVKEKQQKNYSDDELDSQWQADNAGMIHRFTYLREVNEVSAGRLFLNHDSFLVKNLLES